jgi:hypothetical protein
MCIQYKLNQLDLTSACQLAQQSKMEYTVTLTALAIILAAYSFRILKPSPFPLVNGKRLLELTNVRPKKEFMLRAREMIAKRLEKAPELPFRVMADVGEILILPPKYAYEIRNHDQLSFTQATLKVCSHKMTTPDKLLT